MENLTIVFNHTDHSMQIYQIYTVCFLSIVGRAGIILNAAFLALSLSKKELQNDYSLFLNSIAFLNLIYCINNIVTEVLVIFNDVPGCSWICSLAGIIFVSSGLAASCIKPFYAINQYWTLFYPEKKAKYFTCRKSLIMVVATSIICLVLALIRFVVKDLGRINGTFCGVHLGTTNFIIEIAFVVPTAIFTKVCIYCVLKIRRLLRSEDSENKIKLESRLPDARAVMKLIFVQVAVPGLLEIPMVIVSVVLRASVQVSEMIIAITVCLPTLAAALYPFFIVYFLKQYQKCALEMWQRITFCKKPNSDEKQAKELAIIF